MHLSPLEVLKHRLAGLRPKAGLLWGPKICISRKVPGDAADQGPHFENCYSRSMEQLI